MEFVVPCLINISDFILIGISFVSILDLIKGHEEGQRSSSAISESLSKCYYEFTFKVLLDKTYLGF